MATTVDSLLTKPFLNRTRAERIEIIRKGKPRPALPNLMSVDKNTETAVDQGSVAAIDQNSAADQGPVIVSVGSRNVIVFDPALYDDVEWLTGCDLRQSLFCWSCLLFRFARDAWNKTGIRNLNDLQQKIENHTRCLSHIQSSLDLKMYIPENERGDPSFKKVTPEEIRKNREIARRIIDAVCVSAGERHITQSGHRNPLKLEDCISNLQLIRDYVITETSLIDDAVDRLKSSPEFLGDMVKAITDVMKESIRKDLQQSTFASLILSEHSRESGRSRISVVIRHLLDGEVCERFVGFVCCKEDDKTCDSIFRHMCDVIDEFQISEKFLAFSMDTSVLRDLEAFNQHLEALRESGNALFFAQPHVCYVPCHFHKLDRVLIRALSTYKVCDIFFKCMVVLKSYFPEGSEARELFENVFAAKHKIEKNSPVETASKTEDLETASKTEDLETASQSEDLETASDVFHSADHSKFLAAIKLHRKDCIRFLEQKLEVSENYVEGDVAKIKGLCPFLKNFKAVFLLELFTKYLSEIFPLFEALYNDSTGKTLDAALMQDMCKSILDQESSEEIGSAFETMFEVVVETLEKEKKPVPKSVSNEINNKAFYSAFFTNTLKILSFQIRHRFLIRDKVEFFNVLNLKKKGKPLDSSYVKKLTQTYETCLDSAGIDKEIVSLEDDKAILNCDSVYQMMEVFSRHGLSRSHPNLYKLLELVLTLPCSPPNLSEGPSKLDDLTAWPDEHGNIGDSSLMGIESDYLIELKKRYIFPNDVMIRFQERNVNFQVLET